ncbi:DUF4214 domain-containing protein [Coleofasciculus sp. H7-2]|uniref:DUF4214 domain-containing protein n=1 Tax=Coleofasciculus sp. H7-2 TaxID=3351545 RepID=UPI00366D4C5D
MKIGMDTTARSLRSAVTFTVLSALIIAPVVLSANPASAEPNRGRTEQTCFLGICWDGGQSPRQDDSDRDDEDYRNRDRDDDYRRQRRDEDYRNRNGDYDYRRDRRNDDYDYRRDRRDGSYDYRRNQSNVYNNINRIYQNVLGRKADNRGLRLYRQRVESGWSLEKVRRDIADSSEAEQVINRLYQNELGRNGDREGLRTYKRRLADGWSLDRVRQDISRSREARSRRGQ